MLRLTAILISIIQLASIPAHGLAQDNLADVLPGTTTLEMSGDIASELVAGVDRFLLDELQKSVGRRHNFWNRDFSSADAYRRSIEPNRARLAHILGVRDPRVTDTEPRLLATASKSALVGRSDGYKIYSVTWPAFGDVTGRGLLLVPTGRQPIANVIAVPDCNQIPEQLVGLVEGVQHESQFARRLAESGCRVVVPVLINRQQKLPNLSNREWIYRSAFELGRGLIGYEVQKLLAVVDWFSVTDDQIKVGMFGWGEGGLLTLYAGSLDSRIDVVGVSGYFDSRQNIWQEPIDRNVFGLLEQFGDAELASMIAPRSLIVEACRAPESTIAGGRGAPARIVTPTLASVRDELKRARNLVGRSFPFPVELIESHGGNGPYGTEKAIRSFSSALASGHRLKPASDPPESLLERFDPSKRHRQQLDELDRHNQRLLRESHYLRQTKTVGELDFASLPAYEKSTARVRKYFYEEIIGRFPNAPGQPNARTRKFDETEKWVGYEVVMDVFPDVIAYGLLLVPKGLKEGERRPVVVCQHGLEGRPQHTIGSEGAQYYSAFSAKLAERGFVTFAPQNLYIFGDRFRSLQRKANPLKKTLFSIITPQHQQIVDWLQTLDFVDPDRIAFYGLSYGGKTAMRVPAIVTDYCLSICSADFNEWVDKNASTLNPRSYVNSSEYEIFEFDLGSTFNYAEMAALIAPRPFMVERGHHDGVADDWTVAYEYAKVRNLYAAKLNIPHLTEIEWFNGPHSINGVGTFDFLHRHLKHPKPTKEK